MKKSDLHLMAEKASVVHLKGTDPDASHIWEAFQRGWVEGFREGFTQDRAKQKELIEKIKHRFHLVRICPKMQCSQCTANIQKIESDIQVLLIQAKWEVLK